MWKCLFLFGVFYFQLPLFSTDFIYQTVKGSLSNPCRFHFKIFPSELKGVILYCFDHKRNQFGIITKSESENEKSVRIIFNDVTTTVKLKSLCGCDPCSNIMMNFDIYFGYNHINICCTSTKMGEKLSFFIGNNGDQNKDKENNKNPIALHSRFPFPKSLVDDHDKMYITMGNIGLYVDEENNFVQPFKEQMVACLDKFYLNDKEILFNKNGTKMEPFCPKICEDNICNGGQCRKSVENNVVCDCNSVAFNGPYCNRSLDPYVKGGPNSFRKVKGAPYVYFKMTWKTVIPKVYCLMEIISKYKNITIFINKTILYMDLNNVSDLDLGNINFINVNITNNYLTITRKDKEYKYEGSLDMETRINVGFCERYKNYNFFEGEYDFSYISSQLVYEKSAPINTTTKSLVSKQIISWDIRTNILIILSIILIILFICVIYATFQLRIKQDKIYRERSSAIQFNDVQPMHLLDTSSISHGEPNNMYMDNIIEDDIDGYSVIGYTNMYNSTQGTSFTEKNTLHILDVPSISCNDTDYIYMHNTKQKDTDEYMEATTSYTEEYVYHISDFPSISCNDKDYIYMQSTKEKDTEEYMELTTSFTEEYVYHISDFPFISCNDTDYTYIHSSKEKDTDEYMEAITSFTQENEPKISDVPSYSNDDEDYNMMMLVTTWKLQLM